LNRLKGKCKLLTVKSVKQTVYICLLFCVGCHSGVSSQSSKNWATGREALQSIMTAANQWSPDADAIRLFSGTCRKAPREGVCGEWRAVVVSLAKKKSGAFYWRGGAVPQGDLSDSELPYKESGIQISKIKADSDAAFRIAEEHGGRPLLEKNPATEVRYAMMWDKSVKQLIWLVFYDIKGTDISSAKLHVAANAETGGFLQ
jgi:hypothetical protein